MNVRGNNHVRCSCFTDKNEELSMPVNIALHHPAFQKDGSEYWTGTGNATLAVDGYAAPENSNDHCSHTDKLPQPWWAVDLFEAMNIAIVKITNFRITKVEHLRKFPQYILFKYYLASEKVI